MEREGPNNCAVLVDRVCQGCPRGAGDEASVSDRVIVTAGCLGMSGPQCSSECLKGLLECILPFVNKSYVYPICTTKSASDVYFLYLICFLLSFTVLLVTTRSMLDVFSPDLHSYKII